MADFEKVSQQETKNAVDPEENAVVLVDYTNPTYRAVIDSSGALKVTGAGGGEQYADGTADTGVEKGNVALGSDGSNFYYLLTNNLGRLQVDVIGGGGTSGQLVQDAEAVNVGDVGRILAGSDGSNYRHVAVDSAGQLQIDVVSSALPTGAATEATLGTLLTEATFAAEDFATQTTLATLLTEATFSAVDFATQTTLAALLTELQLKADLTETQPVDVIDRAARDLGKVDIAAFDVSLPAGDNNIGNVDIVTDPPLLHSTDSVRVGDGTNLVNVLDDSGTYRLQVEAKIASGGANQPARIVDGNQDPIDIQDGVAVPAGVDSGLQVAGPDLGGTGRVVTVTRDSDDGKNRLEISGKISVSAPPPPPAATPKQIAADTPLDVTGTHNTDYEITDGTTFTIQSFTAGAEGDPTEKGAKVSIFYIDASSVSHLVADIYLTGETVQTFPDTSVARDGTSLDGTAAAGTGVLRVAREQFGGGTRELDSVVRGFEE